MFAGRNLPLRRRGLRVSLGVVLFAITLGVVFWVWESREGWLGWAAQGVVREEVGQGMVRAVGKPGLSGRVSDRARVNGVGGEGERRVSEGVHFNGRHLIPLMPGEARVRLRKLVEQIPAGSGVPVVLGFAHVLSGREEEALRGARVQLKGFVPSSGYLARLEEGSKWQDPVFEALNVVEGLGLELKVDPGLMRGGFDSEEVGVRLHVWSRGDVGEVARRLGEAGHEGWVDGGGAFSDTLVQRVARVKLGELLVVAAAMPQVIHVEPAGSARLLNNSVQGILQSGGPQGPRPFFDAGIYGSNQVIAICDTGLDWDSCYFRDPLEWPAIQRRTGSAVNSNARKVVAVNFWAVQDDPSDELDWDNDGHGTMVAGCAAGWKVGLPYASPSYHGMAPGSKLVIQDCGFVGVDVCADLVGLGCPVTNFFPILQQAYAQGARIHNNSWGDLEEVRPHNWYTEPTRELDAVMWEHRDFLVVCAAGNDTLTNTVDSPSVAKNGLSVGATGNGSGFDRMASFSSRGWASDGRWKPDVVAPGEGIISSASDRVLGSENCGVTVLSGTSFSSPAVAGMAALVRDYFAQGFYPYESPGVPSVSRQKSAMSAALVKGVLIQSAIPLLQSSGSIPGRDQGWGRVNLSRALPLKDGDASLWVRDEQGGFGRSAVGSYVAYVRVRSSREPLKVTLVWTDPPATVGADYHLVNDLDLHVWSAGKRWRGNHFQGGWSVEGGGGGGDELNNVERVLLSQPEAGVYKLEIEPVRLLPQWGAQDFALVVNGDMEVYTATQDSDGDGMADGWEMFYWTHLDRDGSSDADGDGVVDREEYGAGTNPVDAASALRLTARVMEGGFVELQCWVPRDRDVTVEFSDVMPSGGVNGFEAFENRWVVAEARLRAESDAEGGAWVRVVDDGTSASSGRLSATGSRYYRLKSNPSLVP